MDGLEFHLITLFPEMFSTLEYGITGRALKSKLLQCYFYNPRDYTQNKQGRVDDSPYGGGPGQIMQVQPLREAILDAKKKARNLLPENKKIKTIYLSPQGKRLTQLTLESFKNHVLILVCGRYEGIDERIIERDIDEEYSIGDYVLSGGELPAMVFIDAMTRLHPQALGNPDSAHQDSFSSVSPYLLDCPHYTRPESIDGQSVPKVLLSGNHEEIKQWRHAQALKNTALKRPDLFEQFIGLNSQEQLSLHDFIDRPAKVSSKKE